MLKEGPQLGWNPAVQESQTCCGEVAAWRSGPSQVKWRSWMGATQDSGPSQSTRLGGQSHPSTFTTTQPAPGVWILLTRPAWPQKTERLDRLTQTRMGAQCRGTGWSLLPSFLLNVPPACSARGSSSTHSEGHCQGLYTHWRTEFSDPQRSLLSPLRDEGCKQRLGTQPPGSVSIPQVPS